MQPFSLIFVFKFISSNHILKSENQILLNEEKKTKHRIIQRTDNFILRFLPVRFLHSAVSFKLQTFVDIR